MRHLVDIATQIALMAHGGDKNKHDGELYLLHVQRVAIGARSFALQLGVGQNIAECVGWLHDCIEDTVWTYDNVRCEFEDYGDGCIDAYLIDDIICALRLVTKDKKGQTNEAYYNCIKPNSLARAVKLADMTDNFRRNYLIVDPITAARLAKKYSHGLDVLSADTTLARFR